MDEVWFPKRAIIVFGLMVATIPATLTLDSYWASNAVQSATYPATSENTVLKIPMGCSFASGCQVGFNFSVTRPEMIVLNYTGQVPIYAELDYLTNGRFVEVMHSPASIHQLNGLIEESVVCNFGTYRYWLNSDGYNLSRAADVAVGFQTENFNFTGTCG